MKSITTGSNLWLSQKYEPILYFSISTERPLLQNEERELLFIHEFKITNHNYRSTVLSTYPSKSSTNPLFSQLIPSNPPTNIGWDILSTFPWSSPWN